MRLKDQNIEIPNEYMCPISMELMQEPVMAADGFTYERYAIERWLASHDSSPMTNLMLPHQYLIPNWNLKQAIETFVTNANLQFDRSGQDDGFRADTRRSTHRPSGVGSASSAAFNMPRNGQSDEAAMQAEAFSRLAAEFRAQGKHGLVNFWFSESMRWHARGQGNTRSEPAAEAGLNRGSNSDAQVDAFSRLSAEFRAEGNHGLANFWLSQSLRAVSANMRDVFAGGAPHRTPSASTAGQGVMGGSATFFGDSQARESGASDNNEVPSCAQQ